jgi:hypothetical protein
MYLFFVYFITPSNIMRLRILKKLRNNESAKVWKKEDMAIFNAGKYFEMCLKKPGNIRKTQVKTADLGTKILIGDFPNTRKC